MIMKCQMKNVNAHNDERVNEHPLLSKYLYKEKEEDERRKNSKRI